MTRFFRKVGGKLAKALLPASVRKTLNNYEILSVQFGQFETMRKWESVDGEGAPIPWYCYPAIEYVKQLDLSDKRVFEYGLGNSTLFWADRCEKVVSVEDSREWFDKISTRLPGAAECLFCESKKDYVNSIHGFDVKFDLIVVDGSYRSECASESLKMLSEDGFIILDNSDWNEAASAVLRDADLIEVDMSGFGPINGYTTTTSFYFRRNVRLRPAYDRQPVHGVGSLKHRDR